MERQWQGRGQQHPKGVDQNRSKIVADTRNVALSGFVSCIGPLQPFGLPSGSQTANQLVGSLEKQQRRQEQLDQRLKVFWASQLEESERSRGNTTNTLPLAKIRKIMKADMVNRKISAEAPIIFARACEMFIMDLTLRSWSLAVENRRRSLLKDDIKEAIMCTNVFAFLNSIVSRDDMKEVIDAQIACGIPKSNSSQVGTSAMDVPKSVMDSAVHVQQHHSYPSQQMWQQKPQDRQPSSNP
ncbi:Transcription factor CBF/NF-Y/archaeal histone domain [Dillenia turbinata]|uniref:Transcription factor CBF/NF-Y/archaeal histone domain n=1 Tax=Dillenia turbinata TaxID=194707 RepID=A0AAN8UKQ4_9MAGN